MAKKIIFSFILLLNTRALEDRALFTIEDKVFFVSKINSYIQALNFIYCYQGSETYLHRISGIGKSVDKININDQSYSQVENKLITQMATSLKVIKLSGNTEAALLNSRKAKECNLSSSFRSEINEILTSSRFLAKNILSKGLTDFQINEALENYKKSFKQKIKFRGFY